jgi:hypothetical protein
VYEKQDVVEVKIQSTLAAGKANQTWHSICSKMLVRLRVCDGDGISVP